MKLPSPLMALRFLQLEFSWGRGRPRAETVEPEPLRKAAGGDEFTAWCAEAARGLGLEKLARRVRVMWNPRMRTTAGRAWWPEQRIELNPRLRELPEEEMWRTIKHELAHLVAYERCGRRRVRAHGPEWQQACADLGIPGESACHELPFERRPQRRKFAYTCPNCGAVIERVRKIRYAAACWACCREFSGGRFDKRFRLIEAEL